jgi:hypothetical protein
MRTAPTLLLAIALCTSALACTATQWRDALGMSPPAAQIPPPLPPVLVVKPTQQRPHRQVRKPSGQKTAEPKAPEVEPEEVEDAKPGQPAAAPPETQPPPPVTLRLAPVRTPSELSADRKAAVDLIDQATVNLRSIDRSALSDPDSADYDRVAAFIRDARAALREEDYLAAHGLARKAWLLSSELGRRNSMR